MIIKTCLKCNKEFKTYPSLNRVMFCSQKCYHESKIGEKRPNWIKKKISRTCKERGLKGPIRYGKNCNFWKGGVNTKNKTLYRLIRELKMYKDWRKKVMNRDNYTCLVCGLRGNRLEVDHYPYSFSKIIKIFTGITKARQARHIDFLWDIDNGRTLCKKCHIKYGNKDY